MKITEKFLTNMLTELQNISFEAGEILLDFQKKRHELNIQNKGVDGIATQADKASEEFILNSIKPLIDGAYFLAEESCAKEEFDLSKHEFSWVIDPLDGTNNFVNGIPIFATSIGLMHYGKPIVGVVYNPLNGECFFAAKNLGSYYVDYRVNPLKKFELLPFENSKKMSECVFSPAPSYEKVNKFENQISSFKKNIIGARAVRRLGCAAIELCYVAKGNFDGYWEKGLKPWDTSAAWIICEEAGVKVSDFFGEEYTTATESILVARESLHSRILGRLGKK